MGDDRYNDIALYDFQRRIMSMVPLVSKTNQRCNPATLVMTRGNCSYTYKEWQCKGICSLHDYMTMHRGLYMDENPTTVWSDGACTLGTWIWTQYNATDNRLKCYNSTILNDNNMIVESTFATDAGDTTCVDVRNNLWYGSSKDADVTSTVSELLNNPSNDLKATTRAYHDCLYKKCCTNNKKYNFEIPCKISELMYIIKEGESVPSVIEGSQSELDNYIKNNCFV